MLRHRIFLSIWLALFVASAFFCIKAALSWRTATNSVSAMKNAILCELDVDFARQGVYSAEFRHSSTLSPHGEILMVDLNDGENSRLAEILEESETYVGIYDNDEELFSERLLSLYHVSDISSGHDGKNYTAFFRMPFHHAPKTYTIKFDVRKPAQKQDATYSIISRYDFCGLESLFVLYTLAMTCLTGFLALLFLSCALWRIHLINSMPVSPSGSKTMYLLSVYPRWSETFLRNDIRHLAAEGVQLELFSLFPGNCEMEEDWPKAVVLSPYAGWGSEQAMQNGHRSKLRELPCPRWVRLHFSLFKHRQLLKAIVAECKQNGIGHIHAEFADLAALLGSIAAKKAGCTFSIGIHALDVHKLKYPAHALFDNAKFITVCNQAAAIAFSNACPWAKQKLHIIHHGIELQKWPFVEKRDTGELLKILYCGRLVPKKGLSLLIDAIEILNNHAHSQATLTIVGEGPLEAELKAQVAALGLDSSVTFLGRLKQSEMREHFADASCLCAPSIVTKDGDMDGVPNVILEAMATGLPVIGSLAGSLGEVITAETAWPVQEVTPHNLADAILDMASQPSETERRRHNARNHVEYRFDAEKLAKKRAALY